MSDRTLPDAPRELGRLLHAATPPRVEAAWADFVETYTKLLLHVARSVTSDRDAAMDAYAYLLERLREDDFRRLRSYVPDAQSKFTTWLVTVARRACLDWYRQRYGRPRAAASEAARAAHVRRRRLAALVTDETLDPSAEMVGMIADVDDGPEVQLRVTELHAALDGALAALPPADQVLLKLRYEDGLSAQAVACVLHYPSPFHVYRRVNAALAELRATLRARGIENSVP